MKTWLPLFLVALPACDTTTADCETLHAAIDPVVSAQTMLPSIGGDLDAVQKAARDSADNAGKGHAAAQGLSLGSEAVQAHADAYGAIFSARQATFTEVAAAIDELKAIGDTQQTMLTDLQAATAALKDSCAGSTACVSVFLKLQEMPTNPNETDALKEFVAAFGPPEGASTAIAQSVTALKELLNKQIAVAERIQAAEAKMAALTEQMTASDAKEAKLVDALNATCG